MANGGVAGVAGDSKEVQAAPECSCDLASNNKARRLRQTEEHVKTSICYVGVLSNCLRSLDLQYLEHDLWRDEEIESYVLITEADRKVRTVCASLLLSRPQFSWSSLAWPQEEVEQPVAALMVPGTGCLRSETTRTVPSVDLSK